MKKLLTIGAGLALGFSLAIPTGAEAQTKFISIGTGGVTGVYYPAGK